MDTDTKNKTPVGALSGSNNGTKTVTSISKRQITAFIKQWKIEIINRVEK
jgi:hypothetical protein